MGRAAFVLGIFLLLAGCGGSAPAPTPQPAADDRLDPATINELTANLRSDQYPIQLGAVWEASALGPRAKPLLPVLIDLLKDRNRLVREEVALCLSYVDPTGDEVVVPLSLATRDESEFVRSKAAKALERFGPRASPALNDLITLLRDEYSTVRHAAARTLGAIGPAAFPARAHLVAMAQDEFEEPSVRAIARDSIKWIDDR